MAPPWKCMAWARDDQGTPAWTTDDTMTADRTSGSGDVLSGGEAAIPRRGGMAKVNSILGLGVEGRSKSAGHIILDPESFNVSNMMPGNTFRLLFKQHPILEAEYTEL